MPNEIDFNKYFNTPQSIFVNKAMDFLEGQQLQHVIAELDNSHQGRKQWKERGLKPSYRNLTQKIIRKSAMLFNDGPPSVELKTESGDINEEQSENMLKILDDIRWVDFLTNYDQTVRNIKTGIILVQYDAFNDNLVLDELHRGNSWLEFDTISKQPLRLVYRVHQAETTEEANLFTVFTNETREVWKQDNTPGAMAELIRSEDNLLGVIPIATTYDTMTPRSGYWVKAPQDLVIMNEIYNMHLVDVGFAVTWATHQTLFTNAEIMGDEAGQNSAGEVQEVFNQELPRQISTGSSQGIIGGPGKVVTLNSNGVENVFLEYKGPIFDLEMPVEVVRQWVKDSADDWGVRVTVVESSVTSGFQLVVEEADNIELRKMRSRMMEQGLEDFIKIAMRVWNTGHEGAFDETLIPNVMIQPPSLPVDNKEQEEIWDVRIAGDRASRIDYLMQVHQLSRQEAEEKLKEIIAFKIAAPEADIKEVIENE